MTPGLRDAMMGELFPADFLMRFSRFINEQTSGNIVLHYDHGKLLKFEVHEVYRPAITKD